MVSSGQCILLDNGEFAQFIVAFTDSSNKTHIVISNLINNGLHPEVPLIQLSRDQELQLSVWNVESIVNTIHVIPLYDQAHTGRQSSKSFLLNDFSGERFRVIDRKIYRKCHRADCPGIEIMGTGHHNLSSMDCGCTQ
jgi:hypothetical protein